MSTKIRLTRLGSMKRPFYRLVVIDSRDRRDGRYIENLGTYNPIPKTAEVSLREDRILHWLGQGAQISNTAASLMREAGVLEKFHLLRGGVAPADLAERLAEHQAKLPRSAGGKLNRAEKKAQKKAASKAGGSEESAGESAEA